MDFFTENNAPRREGDIVFHYRRVGALIFWLFLGACALILLAIGVAGGITLTREMVPEQLNEIAPSLSEAISSRGFEIDRTPAFFVGGFLLLFWRFLKMPIAGGFGPSGWLARMGREGLQIKFRSYMNASFPPEDLVVALVPWHEIEWARQLKEHLSYRSSSSKGGTTHEFSTYLELKLNSRDLENLSQHLRRERTRKSPRGAAWRHYPVQLDEEGHLKIKWSARPKVATALEALKSRVTIRKPLKLRTALEKPARESTEEAEQAIIRLVEEGKTFAAIAAVRKAYTMSLTDAKQFVDDLVQNGPPEETPAPQGADHGFRHI